MKNALTAVSLAFPIQSLMMAVAVGTAIGIGSLLSKSLGEQAYESANKAAENGFFLAVMAGAVFAAFGLLGAGLFFSFQTDNAQIAGYGTQYVRIVCCCSVFSFLQVTIERIMQAVGKPVYNMVTQITGAVVNILLDPILIFGLLGFPRLEVVGAAIATVTGQFVAVLLAFGFFLTKAKDVKINARAFKPNIATIGKIYQVGVPSIVAQSLASVMTFGMNRILMGFSPTATAVYGVYYKMQSFVYMPLFGLNAGMIPIVAYNYGAQKKDRITKTVLLGTETAVVVMVAGLLIFQLAPEYLMRHLFEASDEMVAIGIKALRSISWGFLFAAFSLVLGAVFQALGNGVYSLLVSLCRQLVIVLPVASLLGHTFGLDMVWWALPLAEFCGVILSAFLYLRIYRKKICTLDNPESSQINPHPKSRRF